MSTDMLNYIGIVIAILVSILSLVVTYMRSGHQNTADDGAYVKNMAETATITTAARLEAEKSKALLEKRVTDLEKLLNSMAYRVTFIVHTGEEPRIERVSVERFSDRRIDDVEKLSAHQRAGDTVKLEKNK